MVINIWPRLISAWSCWTELLGWLWRGGISEWCLNQLFSETVHMPVYGWHGCSSQLCLIVLVQASLMRQYMFTMRLFSCHGCPLLPPFVLPGSRTWPPFDNPLDNAALVNKLKPCTQLSSDALEKKFYDYNYIFYFGKTSRKCMYKF